MTVDTSKFPMRTVKNARHYSDTPVGSYWGLTLECGHRVNQTSADDVRREVPCKECFDAGMTK